ncbi:MAG: aldehyde dehydrogenase family protein [Actinobacteria bacterium]|nr:aldehyde dehydrogenase family protein [Actinomycetota bacterium]
MNSARMLIGGRLCEASASATYQHRNPYTEEELGPFPDASVADMETAIGAARAAFEQSGWADDPEFRARCIEQLHVAVSAHRDEFVDHLVTEIGCVRKLAESAQLLGALEWLTTSIEYTRAYEFEFDAPEVEAVVNYAPGAPKPARRIVLNRPWGVVGALSAYNYPLAMILGKIGPALGAGNTVVLKPSAQAPRTALLVARLAAEETDIPAGVLNVVIGTSPELGKALVGDPRVGMVAFTGSAAVGRSVGEVAAGRFAKAVLELGGKSASIVLEDADALAAARASVVRVCLNGGQGCTNLTRLLVPRSEYDEVLEVAAATCGEVVWGDPSDPGTQLGPMIDRRHQDRVLGFVKRAVEGGARLIGGSVERPEVERGYFVPPTVLADVSPDAEIVQEEVFGPVLTILPYDGGDDGAVDLANNSHYGLGGAIFSGSDAHGLEVARRVYTGVLDVNGASCRGADVPFGGCKDSGLGREGGMLGFQEYLETRMIGVPRA